MRHLRHRWTRLRPSAIYRGLVEHLRDARPGTGDSKRRGRRSVPPGRFDASRSAGSELRRAHGHRKGAGPVLEGGTFAGTCRARVRVQVLGSNHWDRFEADDYQRELSSLAAELERLGVEVRRPGHISRANLPTELARAHIHVVPARWDEPFGMTTIEGMACGLATVASATGGTPEVAGDAALLFERESVDGLATHLDRLLADEALRRDYARRGIEPGPGGSPGSGPGQVFLTSSVSH